MNDTTRRFLNAIVEKVPTGGTIAELRLFPAIRQGGVESGVAVVAVETPDLVLADVAASGDDDASSSEARDTSVECDAEVVEYDGDDGDAGDASDAGDAPLAADVTGEVEDAVEMLEVLEAEVQGDAAGDPSTDAAEAESRDVGDSGASVVVDAVDVDVDVDVVEFVELKDADETTDATAEVIADAAATQADAESPAGASHGEAPLAADGDDDSPYAPELPTSVAEEIVLEVQDAPALPFKRFAILTARYRLVFKGPDRGKWEMEITHEADAPLATVERVARGVAKRAGEENEPEHFSAASLRTALDAPAWVSAT